jgi:hypothetical protein
MKDRMIEAVIIENKSGGKLFVPNIIDCSVMQIGALAKVPFSQGREEDGAMSRQRFISCGNVIMRSTKMDES